MSETLTADSKTGLWTRIADGIRYLFESKAVIIYDPVTVVPTEGMPASHDAHLAEAMERVTGEVLDA